MCVVLFRFCSSLSFRVTYFPCVCNVLVPLLFYLFFFHFYILKFEPTLGFQNLWEFLCYIMRLRRHYDIFRPYYEVKANLNGLLDGQKARILHLEHRVLSAKTTYADALKNLESISNEIHKVCNFLGKIQIILKK